MSTNDELEQRNFRLERKKFYLTLVSVVIYALALFLSLYSVCTTRSLFNLQNKAHIDIKEIYTGGLSRQRCQYTYLGTELQLYNAGNLPGMIEKIAHSIKYKEIQIDTTFEVNVKVFPKESEPYRIEFGEPKFSNFIITIDSVYHAKQEDYRDNLRFKFIIYYECEEIGENYHSESLWRHDPYVVMGYSRSK